MKGRSVSKESFIQEKEWSAASVESELDEPKENSEGRTTRNFARSSPPKKMTRTVQPWPLELCTSFRCIASYIQFKSPKGLQLPAHVCIMQIHCRN